jgi:lysophospholipase L1-like esterase
LLANAGVGGERTDQILARVEADVLPHQPQWVTVLGGTNDVSQNIGAEPIIFNLTRIYDALDAAGIRFIAITIPPQIMMTPEQLATHNAVNTWLRERVQADWPGSLLGDWSAALSVDGDGVSPIPEYFPDGVHLGLEGAQAAGQALAPTLAAILEEAPAE